MLQNATHDLPSLADRLLPFAQGLTIPRHRLRAYYDAWVDGHDAVLPVTGFLHAIALGLDAHKQIGMDIDANDNAVAFCVVLAGLGDTAAMIAFFAAASGAGLFDPPSAPNPESIRSDQMAGLCNVLEANSFSAILESGFQGNGMGGAGFEAMDGTAIWKDPGRILPAIILARRRLCLVKATNALGKPTTGTGFLIGPSAVLTCRHVVKGLPNTLPEVSDGDETSLQCAFDFSHTSGLRGLVSTELSADRNWRLCESATGNNRPLSGRPQWWTEPAELKGWLESNAGKLDYVVIRLDGTPGLQRGWYDLQKLPDRRHDEAMTMHHPSGSKQTITFGPTSMKAEAETRIFHQSATTNGSSGGLVMNEFGEPIALHQSGESFQLPAPLHDDPDRRVLAFMNIAVPLDMIAKDILDNPAAHDQIGKTARLVPARGCLADKRPLFGRKNFLDDLNRMIAADGPRVMLVHLENTDPPLRKPGMSFTIDIVKALLPPSQHHHIVFRAGEAETDAEDMARKMLRTVSPGLEEKLPDHPDTTMAAFAQTLVSLFGDGVEALLHNQMVWVMIDDLDKHGVTDASGREFLTTIYKRVENMPQLRIILIGLPPDIEISGLPEDIIRSQIAAADLTNFDAQFTDWLQERMGRDVPFNDDSLEFIAQTVVQYAGMSSPLENMAAFVTANIDPVADRMLDQGDGGE